MRIYYIALLLLPALALSQKAAGQDTIKPGKVVVNVDKKVNDYLEQRRHERQNDSLVKGYRIQIIITEKRADAKAAKEKVAAMYPGCEAYLIFDSPNFKVRVGDFKTKLEAQPLLFKLTEEFPTLFLVEDKINKPSVVPCY